MSWISPIALRRTGVLGMNQRNVRYISRYNDRRYFPLVDNKLTTKVIAERAGLAVPGLISVIDTQHAVEQFRDSVFDLDEFVAKPAQGSGGKGILVITGRDGNTYRKASGDAISVPQIKRHLTNTLSGLHSLGGRNDVAFIEELVHINPYFDQFSYEGVPDIRLIAFQGYPIMGMLRLATKESDGKANLHQGAIGVGLDIATGQAIQAVQHNRVVTHHPDSGADLAEISIPNWLELLTLSARCYEATRLGYLGCDIVIDKHRGPLILELNARPGLSIQIANNAGLLPRLRRIEEEQSFHYQLGVSERVDYAREHFASHHTLEQLELEIENQQEQVNTANRED